MPNRRFITKEFQPADAASSASESAWRTGDVNAEVQHVPGKRPIGLERTQHLSNEHAAPSGGACMKADRLAWCRMPQDASVVLSETIARCRAAGLRRTHALEAVLGRLVTSEEPLTLADIAESAPLRQQCDKATVYRLLMRLEEHGIIRRLGLHERSAHFTLLHPGHHDDYLICTECGTIEKLDIACPVEKLEAEISRESGFRKLYHELEFFGVCPSCA